MARMIPPLVSASCTSGGEKEIFVRLRDEPGTKDWIVLHSLDIAHHLRNSSGEADFVVIVPVLGVLCLEVKGCHSLRRDDDGLWYYGTDGNGDPRGPFKQSSEAMHSLRERVVQSEPALSRVPFWSAVMFPFVGFTVSSDEWHPWQVIDKSRYRKQSLASIIQAVLRNARAHLKSKVSCKWFRDEERLPNEQQSAAIARILRPSFEFTEKASDRRDRQAANILRYTEEQFVALDTMAENDRVLFTGPAGTGKTVLSVEAARRASEAGKRVLFLCFNRLLGRWLTKQPALQRANITTRTFHQHMLAVAKLAPPPDPDDAFWRVTLPDKALARLLGADDQLGNYEVLVVDELQDLLRPEYVDVLDAVLHGGLHAGNWRLFGDFERQTLYGQDRDSFDEILHARFGAFARCSLRVNCRNTPRVASLSYLLGKLAPNYSRVLRPDDRLEPVILYYATPSQQRKALVGTLERLFKESFAAEDIVVLSAKGDSKCAAAAITDVPWSETLVPIDKGAEGLIPFTTIQSYKGLEASAVVVTDIEHVDSDLFSSLFYVATTRALERLCILVHETAKAEIVAALTS